MYTSLRKVICIFEIHLFKHKILKSQKIRSVLFKGAKCVHIFIYIEIKQIFMKYFKFMFEKIHIYLFSKDGRGNFVIAF